MNSLKVKVNELPVSPAPMFFVGSVFGVVAASPCRGLYPIRGTWPSRRWSCPWRVLHDLSQGEDAMVLYK